MWCEICVGYVWREICVGYVWCEIRQQSSEEPCDETSFGKKGLQSAKLRLDAIQIETCEFLGEKFLLEKVGVV